MAQSSNLQQGPEPVDTVELHLKLTCKLKIYQSDTKYKGSNCSLLAVSQYYGLIFVGNSNGFSIIKSNALKATTDYSVYPKKDVLLSFKPTHLAVDHSQKLLAVVCSSKPGSILYVYTIASFSSKDITPINVLLLAKITKNMAAEVLELMWQPNSDGIIVTCMSDGSVVSLNPSVKDGAVNVLPNQTGATCLCWSPKGKQIVIGCTNGTLSQYKPDLKLVKTLPAPPLFNGAVSVVSVLWISSFQFAAAYNDKNDTSSFPVITIVNAPKNEAVSVINYEDITYSSTLFRSHQIYMSHQSLWNLIFISSANSIEVAVLHSTDTAKWEQWLLGDASRAELPLNVEKQETFPLGFAFDLSSEDVVPWGEGTLPPAPRLLLLSDEGVLCVFNVVNLVANAPQLCQPPKEQLPDSLFVLTSAAPSATEPVQQGPAAVVPSASVAPMIAPQPKDVQPIQQPTFGQPAFGTGKPTYTFGLNTGFGGFSSQTPSTMPQVSVSVPGQGFVGGLKDVAATFQQQQQQQPQQQPAQPQQQLFTQTLQQVHPQPTQTQSQLQQMMQSQLQQQQSQQIFKPPASQNQSILGAPNLSANTSNFSSSTPSGFTFGMSTTSSIFGSQTTGGTSAESAGVATAASTPASKPTPQTITQTAKPIQGDIFSGKTNLSQSTPIKPQGAAVEATPKPPEPAKVKEPEVKAVENSSKENSGNTNQGTQGVPELLLVDDSVYWNALRDEIAHFNSELAHLSTKVSSLDIQVGTQEQKLDIRKSIQNLNNFWKDLKETTVVQSGEIHSAVTDLMESFAWLEDAKSRNLQRKNPSFIALKKSEELDPISARHMSEISHLKYYIGNQLKQLTSHLEKEWMDHQDNYRMDVKNRMAVPTLEEVYKTMHYHLKILNKQKILVENLKAQMSERKRKTKTVTSVITNSVSALPSSQGSKRISELSKLADNLLQLKINIEDNYLPTENCDVVKSQMKSIRERTQKLTLNKQAALRDILSERDMIKIRPVKSTIETSSFLRSLALEKSARKSLAAKTQANTQIDQIGKVSSPDSKVPSTTTLFKNEIKVKDKTPEKVEVQEKKSEVPKTIFGVSAGSASVNEKPTTPVSMQFGVTPKLQEKSPLSSLSAVVSSVGKEAEVKPKSTTPSMIFGTPKVTSNTSSNAVTSTPTLVFGSVNNMSQTKPEEAKAAPTLTFGLPKPSESIFGKPFEAPKFEMKSFDFGSKTGTTQSVAKVDVVKPVGSTSAATTAVSSKPVTSAFTFTSAPATTSSTTALPKVNLFFNDKVQTPATGTSAPVFSGYVFPQSSSQTSAAPSLVSSTPIFGGAKGGTSIFGTPATTAVPAVALTTTPVTTLATTSSATAPTTTAPTTSFFSPKTEFNFSYSGKGKTPDGSEVSVITSKPETETEDVDVETVDEPKKPEPVADVKLFSKATPGTVFGGLTSEVKTAADSTTTSTPTTTPVAAVAAETAAAPVSQNIISTPTTTAVTTSIFGKPVVTVAVSPTTVSSVVSTASSAVASSATTTTVPPQTSVFSFGSASPLVFCQSTTGTTTGSIFGQAATISTESDKVTSTTPTKSIFGGGGTAPSTPTTTSNIFGGSTPGSKPFFGQASKPVTPTSGSIFGNATPTSTTFGQTSPQATTDSAVSQTANIFGQLLSDSNRSEGSFSASATATTTANAFSTPKNIFGGSSTTTSTAFGSGGNTSLFGGGQSSSSMFGQPTTTANVFGQSPKSTTNTFFGQAICSPFGGGGAAATVTSNPATTESNSFSKPIFGQSVFGQTTNNTSVFGGSPTSSIFGGSSKPSTTGGNVFQTSTTSSFGSTSPGPFSSPNQGSVAKTGFKASNMFQSPMAGGFGSPPVFGGGASASTFGGSPTFSGAATFGSQPAFGSRPGLFDSSSQGGFTQSQGHSTAFENFANQNTVGFGNLAQQSQSQGFGGFASNQAFNNKPAFGGSSFSSWRSK